jgi:hypothetical protein
MMTGLNTLSSKWPFEPAMDTVVWLPMTCAQTMVKASHCVGLTLPGMMEEPGSFAGRMISPIPERGPEPSRRISLAIFIRLTATVFMAPEVSTMASWAARASNLFSAVTNGSSVMLATCFANSTSKPFLELMPVPTAVPPCANW